MREGAAIRVGVIDSAVPEATVGLCASADFSVGESRGPSGELPPHGASIVRTVTDACAGVAVYVATVFDHRLVCSADQVAEAIGWLCGQRVQIINMSFGLREDRDILREACHYALAQGIVLVAASPAQGAACFPASYVGVLRATGDARCSKGEISYLDSAQADFGAYPGDPQAGVAGASSGCAALTGALAQLMAEYPALAAAEAMKVLADRAHYRGREQRGTTGVAPGVAS